MTKSICIVSPDVMGPIFNGGIGTFVYHSAKIFTNDLKHRVTVLMTGATIEKNDRDHWKGWYRDQGIELLFIDDLPRFYGKTVQYFETSHRVHQFLREREFSFVNFQEWLAHGFVSIQAKRTGEAHHRTVLSVTTHSPTEWQDDGMKRLPDGGNEASPPS